MSAASCDAAELFDRSIAMSKKKSKSQQAPTKAPKAPKAAKAAKAKVEKPKRVGALSAAAEVLKKAGKPMRAPEMITAMAEQKLWTSPSGKTPAATLYAAIIREIREKKGEARFKKVDRGQFAHNG